jgi:hypothetical protein
MIKKIISNNYTRRIRNFFSILPTPYYHPKKNFLKVSDFFFWSSNKNFNTKFQLVNLSSNISPENAVIEEVSIWIYNSDGIKIKQKDFIINPFELKEVEFNDLEGYGSFFVFHDFYSKDLKDKKSFAVDRGYVGYKKNNGVWSYMHGNHNACAIDHKQNIQCLIAKSFKHNSYSPQVRFNDCSNFSVILNNPLKSKLKFNISLYTNDKLVENYHHKIKPFGTKKVDLNANNISSLNLNSKILLCRPIILKEYSSYFDIFHG